MPGLKLTKFVHACLLVESEEGTVLIDPGQMSWESGLFDVQKLQKLDSIVITHEHFDHFHLPFIQALLEKFPNVPIVSTNDVVSQLSQASIMATTEPNNLVEVLAWEHESMEPLSGGITAQNIGTHIAGKLTHPGDSYHAVGTKQIFALPLAGPWGAAIEGVRLAEQRHPQYIVPIHDWMWRDEWRLSMYDRCETYFAQKGITFLKPVDGQAIEINLT